MKKLRIRGGKELAGIIKVSGSKNVVLKAVVAACLTDEKVTITNAPRISDLHIMLELIKEIGGVANHVGNTITIRVKEIKNTEIPLEMGAKIRTSAMLIAPLLARAKKASIPNPGGCRIGARPIDRHIEALTQMNSSIKYNSEDGYFHGETSGLQGTIYEFIKNSHTGTETIILAATLAAGVTIIKNAALEPEVDDLIYMLTSMGAKIKRKGKIIEIEGVEKLHGTTFEVGPDRNEVVTFAIASALTGGNILIENVVKSNIEIFLKKFEEAGGAWEGKNGHVRFFVQSTILPTDVTTAPHPNFMTDWQGPWAIFMTQAQGVSTIHETVYENRFGYVEELRKMGAKIEIFNPEIDNPEEVYNFNYRPGMKHQHAVRIEGKTPLHNAVLSVTDLRAGATLVLASLIAKGESVIYGVEHLMRGYEDIEGRLNSLGAEVKLVEE